MQAQMIAVAQLRESGTNPRRRAAPERDAELLESVRALGVLQPVLARPAGEAFELVFGHRRLRAAVAAGLAEIPASVREMTDLEVLEAQVAENAQREDVHPLEEADAYRALHERHGRSVEEIAARIGKSRATVYARLKLCELEAAGRTAFLAGEIEASVALLLARIPSALQTQALEAITPDKDWRDEGNLSPLSYREAQRILQRDFMLEIARVPWALDDAALLPAAGACTTCPKRSGNQPELFADVCTDLCTDIDCFRRKRDASWVQRKAQAKAAGVEVIEAKKAIAALFSYGKLNYNGRKRYLDLDLPLGGGGKKTYRTLLKKSLDGLQRTLARDVEGGIHELAERKAAAKALRALGYDADGAKLRPKGAQAAPEGAATLEEENRLRRLERLAEEAAATLVLSAIDRKFTTLEAATQAQVLRILLEDEIGAGHEDNLRGAAEARGLYDEAEGDPPPYVLLSAWTATASSPELIGLLVGFCVRSQGHAVVQQLAECIALDWEAEKKAAREKLEAGKRKSRRSVTQGKKAAVRTCRECGCTDEDGCYEGCEWVEQDLCSACATEGE